MIPSPKRLKVDDGDIGGVNAPLTPIAGNSHLVVVCLEEELGHYQKKTLTRRILIFRKDFRRIASYENDLTYHPE